MSRVKEFITDSIQTQKNDVTDDFDTMWSDMMGQFTDLTSQMRDDMATYKKEFKEVGDDVNSFGASMKANMNKVKNSVSD
jgi:methyl-accepting chemotaxis protein